MNKFKGFLKDSYKSTQNKQKTPKTVINKGKLTEEDRSQIQEEKRTRN